MVSPPLGDTECMEDLFFKTSARHLTVPVVEDTACFYASREGENRQVRGISREGGWVRRRWLFWDVLVSHLHEQVAVPSVIILPKSSWFLKQFLA